MRTGSRAAVALVASGLALLPAGQASASFNGSTPVVNVTYSSLTVAPAGSLAVSASCGILGSLSATAVLTWTASPTAGVTGVQVLRRIAPAAFTSIATLGPTALTFTDTGLLVNTTYQYDIRTNVSNFYADTAAVSVLTPLLCT
jgi:energy-coupling factor transporter transmembrane protein EcfT